MISLSITTSTAYVGVSVAKDNKILVEDGLITDRQHCEELTPMIERVCSKANVKPIETDRVIVDIGPGRFTGLRVGIASAQAIAFAASAKLYTVSSLQALAAQYFKENDKQVGELIVSIDARRGEVFQQKFSYLSTTGITNEKAELLDPEQIDEVATVAIGDGAMRYHEKYLNMKSDFNPNPMAMVDALETMEPVDNLLIEPLYLREPDAVPNFKTIKSPL